MPDHGHDDVGHRSTDDASADRNGDATPTTGDVRSALRDVTDPALGDDVVAAGLVDSVDVTDGVVTVDAAFTGVDAETADLLTDRMRSAVLSQSGVGTVRIEADAPSPDYALTIEGVDRVVAVASAKGGVGKTTVATQLARGLAAAGESVGLFDADVYGPNIPALLDLDGPLESTAEGAAKPVEADGIQVVSVGLIANDQPVAWRGAMANEAVEELLTAAAWDVDTLVVDLPPGTGDVVLTALQSLPIDGTVLVTTPFSTAVADTERSAALFREEGVPVLGTVVNMASFVCPTCGDEHAPFSERSTAGGNVLAEFPIDEDLRATDSAVPDPFRDLATTVRSALDDADTLTVPDHALDLRGVPDRARVDQVRAEFRALAAGESLYLVTDRRPGRVGAVLDDLADVSPEVTTARKRPDVWAIRITKREAGSTREDATMTGGG